MEFMEGPILKSNLNFKESNSEPDLNNFHHKNQINLNEHDINKLTEVKKVKWDQTVMSHFISW